MDLSSLIHECHMRGSAPGQLTGVSPNVCFKERLSSPHTHTMSGPACFGTKGAALWLHSAVSSADGEITDCSDGLAGTGAVATSDQQVALFHAAAERLRSTKNYPVFL